MRSFLLIAVSLAALSLAPGHSRAEVRHPYAVAVIIGNKTYQNRDIPEVKYADRDAQAVKIFVVDVLGYSEDNIIYVENATESKLLSVFGSADDPEGRLAQYLYDGGKSDVLVYYSGHGVPGLKDGQAYLLPVDADPNTVAQNGYPLNLLYTNLEKLNAHSVTVLLDACFSGGSAGGALLADASVMTRPASPAPPAGASGLTWIAATGANQLANWDSKHRHGLFTEYFLEAVYGRADDPLYGGRHDGKITLAAVQKYLDDEMSHVARRETGRFQKATISGDPALVLASLTPDAPPARHDDEPLVPAPVPAPVPQATPAPVAPAPVVDTRLSDEDALRLTDADRRLVQQWLARVWRDPGESGGVFGQGTRAAIAAYERSIGAPATGFLTVDVFARLRRDAALSTPEPVVTTSQTDEDALKLSISDRLSVQQWLGALGHDTGGVDGAFGTGTRAAIAAYQRATGVLATGYLTGDVLTHLRRDGSARMEAIARLPRSPASAPPTAPASATAAQARELERQGEGAEARHDYWTAIRLYRQAADAGNTAAMFHIGVMYKFGRGASVDVAEARRWLTKAANLGEWSARYALSNLPAGSEAARLDAPPIASPPASFEQANELEKQGEAAEGRHDYWTALRLYRQAADAGSTDAMLKIGLMYKFGQGVSLDRAEARRWLTKAADLGDWSARYALGNL